MRIRTDGKFAYREALVEIPESRVVEETTKRSFLDVNTPSDLAVLTEPDSADSGRVN